MTQLTPTELMAVEVPMEAVTFQDSGLGNQPYIVFIDSLNEPVGHIAFKPNERHTILGTVTEDEIPDSLFKYVEKPGEMTVHSLGHHRAICRTRIIHLLTSNGLDPGKKYLIIEAL